jgi:hypothetical protein
MSFLEDFKKPANWIGYLLGVIGIGLSITFYFYSQKIRSITYQISTSSLIYDSKNSSSAIKLLEKDSVPITDNVYLLTGQIWNNGDLPIDIKDVRQPLSLYLSGARRILDYKITKQTDSLVAQFKLTKINDQSLGIKWDYFDPKYKFDFQIIYTGDTSPNFNINGKILDIQTIKQTSDSKRGLTALFFLCLSIFVSASTVVGLTFFEKILALVLIKLKLGKYTFLISFTLISLLLIVCFFMIYYKT